jgi:hypothetical protein
MLDADMMVVMMIMMMMTGTIVMMTLKGDENQEQTSIRVDDGADGRCIP